MKIVVIASLDSSLLNFRGALLRAFVAAGHEVIAIAPYENPEVPARLRDAGIRFDTIKLARTGLNPFKDVASILQLTRLSLRYRPDIVLSYTIKPVIYGSLVAWLTKVPRNYSLITGLGASFHTPGVKGRLLRIIAVIFYRLALRHSTKVFAQNRDIATLFKNERIVIPDKVIVVPGSGVDTSHFYCSSIPSGPPVFLYLGRLLKDKGIAELVGATRLLKKSFPNARVLLVGDIDPNPASFTVEEVNAWQKEGLVECLGYQSDVRPHLKNCTAFVLPSYHEGLPRSVLEAMAAGRPIITTDVIGCRETVFGPALYDRSLGIKKGINGFLVPVRSTEALATAMKRLADDRDLAIAMGRESRILVEKYFDVDIVNKMMLREMDILSDLAIGIGTL